jgi:hypothetical protein
VVGEAQRNWVDVVFSFEDSVSDSRID